MENWENFIREEMKRFYNPYDSSYYMLFFCKISFEDEDGNSYTGQELRIQSGCKDEDGDFEEDEGMIYTDQICSQNSKGDFFFITNHPTVENIEELNHGNSDLYDWNSLIEILNNSKKIYYNSLDEDLKFNFSYI
jgi:hypothetical protein